jgi:hypothetical protein
VAYLSSPRAIFPGLSVGFVLALRLLRSWPAFVMLSCLIRTYPSYSRLSGRWRACSCPGAAVLLLPLLLPWQYVLAGSKQGCTELTVAPDTFEHMHLDSVTTPLIPW